MPDYRIYKMIGDGPIATMPQIITHDTDEEAVEHAKRLLDGYDIELWGRSQLIIKLGSKRKVRK